MAHDRPDERDLAPQVPTERPDPKAAARDPGPGAEDRPGFDLGGATEEEQTGSGSNTVPGGPRGTRSPGNEGDAGSEDGSEPTGGSGSAT